MSQKQKTINSNISCNSVGIHSGENIFMTLNPAPCDHGIVFRRIDVKGKNNLIKANYKNVTKTNLGTVITNEDGVFISTIEHLMAAIWGLGIDNLLIDVNGAEVPVMDGSSEPFIFLMECAGIKNQENSSHVIEILKKVRVKDGDKFIEVSPARQFSLRLKVSFDHKLIGEQEFEYDSNIISFKNDISSARTFGFKHEIEQLHKMGLAKGGSLDNAVLLDDKGVVNKEGLRYKDEFVRHKVLDFVGDIYLAGYYIAGAFDAYKPGHGINNKMLHEIFKDEANYVIV